MSILFSIGPYYNILSIRNYWVLLDQEVSIPGKCVDQITLEIQ